MSKDQVETLLVQAKKLAEKSPMVGEQTVVEYLP
jgi:hypothetical protein